jgi:peptidoglycan lytic transglycosylase
MYRRCVGIGPASKAMYGRAKRSVRTVLPPIRWKSAFPRRFMPFATVLLALGACSQGTPAPDPGLGVAASPRVTAGRSVPKGGGHYKVGKPYKVAGRVYVPRVDPAYDRSGTASWYGAAFHGRRTANGEIYDMYALTAGHPTMPLPSYAYVTNRDNGRTILVRVNDRGPYVKDRLIDLSHQSARQLGFAKHGLARVRVRYAGRAPLNGDDAAERRYLSAQAWYRGNVNVAAVQSAPLTTGSLGEASAQGGRRTALGGPGGSAMDIGPFATEAEAARMLHELKSFGQGRVWRDGNEPGTRFHVRMGPLARPRAEALAHHMREFAHVAAVVVPQ